MAAQLSIFFVQGAFTALFHTARSTSQGQNWHSPNVTTSLALKMAACRLLNFMNMYDVDFTAHRIALVVIPDSCDPNKGILTFDTCQSKFLRDRRSKAMA